MQLLYGEPELVSIFGFSHKTEVFPLTLTQVGQRGQVPVLILPQRGTSLRNPDAGRLQTTGGTPPKYQY